MSKKISNHVYTLSIGYPLDREEATVDISVDIDPSREMREIKWSDGRPIKVSNDELVATLEMEEGSDKIQCILHRFPEISPVFNTPRSDLHLYLDEFIEALEKGKKLLLNEK
jgi:hypothetical protein